MASRRKARILAFQALYFWESNRVLPASPKDRSFQVPVEELISFAWLEENKRKTLNEEMSVFARALIAGAVENIKEIDALIQKHLDNWDISRLNRVDLAILRMSVYTLLYQTDIPPSIVIDEAIGICREFGADDSYKFVNGVLDSIRKALQERKKSDEQGKK